MSSILPLEHLEVKLCIEGTEYIVGGFQMEFKQPVDYKNQPQHEIMGGQMMITISQVADKNLFLWAKTATMLKSGEVFFRTDLGMTVMKIKFNNAYCIQLMREISDGMGTKTNMIISPEKVSINEVDHANHWV